MYIILSIILLISILLIYDILVIIHFVLYNSRTFIGTKEIFNDILRFIKVYFNNWKYLIYLFAFPTFYKIKTEHGFYMLYKFINKEIIIVTFPKIPTKLYSKYLKHGIDRIDKDNSHKEIIPQILGSKIFDIFFLKYMFKFAKKLIIIYLKYPYFKYQNISFENIIPFLKNEHSKKIRERKFKKIRKS